MVTANRSRSAPVVVADTSGAIIGAELLKSFETVSFLAKLDNNKYYDQYETKRVDDLFELTVLGHIL